MSSIAKLNVSTFTNDELFGFASDVRAILEAVFTTPTTVSEEFTACLSEYGKALKPETDAGPDCYEVHEADAAADAAWGRLRTALGLMSEHPEGRVAEAANRVREVFEGFENPTRMPYATQYGVIDRLLAALDAVEDETLDASLCRVWIEELRAKSAAFHTVYMARNAARSERVLGAVKLARANLIDAYRSLIDVANVMLRHKSSDELEKFAARANELIAKKKVAQKAQKTLKAKQ